MYWESLYIEQGQMTVLSPGHPPMSADSSLLIVQDPPLLSLCAHCIACMCSLSRGIHSSPEELPVEKYNNKESQSTNGSILLQQQLPVDPNRRLSIFSAVLSESATDLTHSLQAISPIKQVLNVLGHNFSDISELIIEFVKVLSGAGVGVGGFSARDKGVEFHECVRAERRRVHLLGWVGGAEFCGEVGEVGEC